MRSYIPPYLASIRDTTGADQFADKFLETSPVGEIVWQAGARQVGEQHRTVGLEAGVSAIPEGRGCGQCLNVRHHVAHHIHGINSEITVFDADVYMHAENQHPLRYRLHFFQETGVSPFGGDILIEPVRERVGSRRDNR